MYINLIKPTTLLIGVSQPVTRFAHFADKKLALGHMKMVTELICQ